MKLRSLGLQSDLALLDAETIDRGHYLVVRSPQEQGFYWGNLLVFAEAPKPGELQVWSALFEREFEDLSEVRHQTFIWDAATEPCDLEEFEAAGFKTVRTVVLTTSDLSSPKYPNADVMIRELRREEDWEALLELKLLCRDSEHELEPFTEYAKGRLRSYRRRIEAEQGEWYAAFVGRRLVASLGIFRSGDAARYQIVETHPEFRRQGICGTLVHDVARRALAREDVNTLVMLADPEYHAARIYESLGFAPSETLVGVCRWPD